MRRFEELAAIVAAAVISVAGCTGRSGDEAAGIAPEEARMASHELAQRERQELTLENEQAVRPRKLRSDESAAGSAAPSPAAIAAADGLSFSSGFDADGVTGGGAADRGGGGKGGPRNVPKTPAAGGSDEGPTRAWFPETFLFDPLVITDDTGAATVRVRVPDRLTTYRVLALGHTRSGAQGGAVASFLGTLPAYVDPIVPPFLVMGDEVRLPIQLINTTDAPIASELSAEAENAELTAPRGARTIPARGSLVEYATLKATRPGAIKLRVRLGDTDAVLRTIDVVPAGKPFVSDVSGTLAAPRSFGIELPAAVDPATARARLLVYPGALAVLRSELGVSTARSGIAEDSYALLLAGQAPALLAALGDQPDAAALRDLSLLAGQRVIRHARVLDVERATQLAAAALAHPQNPVLARLGERAAATLAGKQRPDGTFGGGQGWTLQRVLVATAEATRATAAANGEPAARQRAQAIAVRAQGAFERNAGAIPDGYTAAAMLASGAVTNAALADMLRQRVRDAVQGDATGKWLELGDGIVRADGNRPGRSEATALAVLALEGDPNAAALRADLGATLLGSYSPIAGWGDGRANLACMQAVLALFKAPLPANVKITLTRDGEPVVTGTLDREKLRDVLALEAPGGAIGGPHQWAITAEPAVPGLGFSLALQGYLPWAQAPVTAGLELSVPGAVTAAVGKPVELAVTAVAPSGSPLAITHALPAGVQVDRPSLEALVAAGTLVRFEVADGRIELHSPALQPGQVFAAKYRVIPTLAGTLRSGASRIRGAGNQVDVPPATWTIR